MKGDDRAPTVRSEALSIARRRPGGLALALAADELWRQAVAVAPLPPAWVDAAARCVAQKLSAGGVPFSEDEAWLLVERSARRFAASEVGAGLPPPFGGWIEEAWTGHEAGGSVRMSS